jgi:hypothetical protein
MPTVYANHLSGTITDNPLSSGATTVNAAGFAALPVIAAPDTMWLVLDPLGWSGAPEIVQITAHTAAATSVTVARAQQSTTARSHATGSAWAVAVTKSDLDGLPAKILTTRGDILVQGASGVTRLPGSGTAGLPLVWNGTDPVYQALSGSAIANDSITTAKINSAAVTASKIANGAVGQSQIANGAVGTSQLADGSVTAGKLSGSITPTRVGGRWQRNATQTIAAGTTVDLAIDTEIEDTNGFWSGGASLTIPSGLDGIYVVACSLNVSGLTPSNSFVSGQIVSGSFGAPLGATGGATGMAGSFVGFLSAGQTVRVSLSNGGSSSSFGVAGYLHMYRISA